MNADNDDVDIFKWSSVCPPVNVFLIKLEPNPKKTQNKKKEKPEYRIP